jgi:hypothetical protein
MPGTRDGFPPRARNLDTVPAIIGALPLVVERVAGCIPVMVASAAAPTW